MAVTWRFALFLCILVTVSRGPSLASDDTGHGTETSTTDTGHGTETGTTDTGHDTETGTTDTGSDHGNSSDTGETDSGHDSGSGDHGHSGAPITTLPIVSWKWHHVTTPYLVALWILVSWVCKISESYPVSSIEA